LGKLGQFLERTEVKQYYSSKSSEILDEGQDESKTPLISVQSNDLASDDFDLPEELELSVDSDSEEQKHGGSEPKSSETAHHRKSGGGKRKKWKEKETPKQRYSAARVVYKDTVPIVLVSEDRLKALAPKHLATFSRIVDRQDGNQEVKVLAWYSAWRALSGMGKKGIRGTDGSIAAYYYDNLPVFLLHRDHGDTFRPDLVKHLADKLSQVGITKELLRRIYGEQ
jgi:hypothetical protein